MPNISREHVHQILNGAWFTSYGNPANVIDMAKTIVELRENVEKHRSASRSARHLNHTLTESFDRLCAVRDDQADQISTLTLTDKSLKESVITLGETAVKYIARSEDLQREVYDLREEIRDLKNELANARQPILDMSNIRPVGEPIMDGHTGQKPNQHMPSTAAPHMLDNMLGSISKGVHPTHSAVYNRTVQTPCYPTQDDVMDMEDGPSIVRSDT